MTAYSPWSNDSGRARYQYPGLRTAEPASPLAQVFLMKACVEPVVHLSTKLEDNAKIDGLPYLDLKAPVGAEASPNAAMPTWPNSS